MLCKISQVWAPHRKQCFPYAHNPKWTCEMLVDFRESGCVREACGGTEATMAPPCHLHCGLVDPVGRAALVRTDCFTACPKPTTGEALLKDIFLPPANDECLLATRFQWLPVLRACPAHCFVASLRFCILALLPIGFTLDSETLGSRLADWIRAENHFIQYMLPAIAHNFHETECLLLAFKGRMHFFSWFYLYQSSWFERYIKRKRRAFFFPSNNQKVLRHFQKRCTIIQNLL